MKRVVASKALPEYRLWVEFSDGIAGEVDLSHLVGEGVFSYWEDEQAFGGFQIGEGRAITWTDQVDLCADSLYLKVADKSPGELFPELEPLS